MNLDTFDVMVFVTLANGETLQMPLERAVRLDKPEGAVTVRISATLYDRFLREGSNGTSPNR